MIELLRYARVKPQGLVSAELLDVATIRISFKRFDVETGKEVAPEVCDVQLVDLDARFTDLEAEFEVLKELLALRQK